MKNAIPSTPGIYKLQNTVNGHLYVGSAANLARRKGEHFRALQSGKHANPHLQSAYNHYIADAFAFEVLEHVSDKSDLVAREQYYIDTLVPHYNLAPNAGSTLGVKYSPEARANLSAARRASPMVPAVIAKATEAARIANTGRKLSPEHIAKLKGRKHTPEAIAKMSAAQRGKKNSPEAIAKMSASKRGKVPSPETRAKISAANRGRKQTPEHIEKRAAIQRGKKLSPEHAAKARTTFLGHKHTSEARAKMRAARLGKKQTPEHIAKRAVARREQKISSEHLAKMTDAARVANTGKPRSPEVRAKISATKRAKKLTQQQANQPRLF